MLCICLIKSIPPFITHDLYHGLPAESTVLLVCTLTGTLIQGKYFIVTFPTDSSTQQLGMELVGSISLLGTPTNLTFLANESTATLWPGGLPRDGTPREKENYPLLPLMVVCYTYASAGICFAIVCFIFNIVFRNKK